MEPEGLVKRMADGAASGAMILLSLAACVVLGAQLHVASIEKPLFNAQLNYSAQRLTAVRNTQQQTDEAIKTRDEQIKLSAELEVKYAALLTDLLELAKTDPDARALVVKWKMQQQGQPPLTESRPASSGSEQKAPKANPAPSNPSDKLKTPFSPSAP